MEYTTHRISLDIHSVKSQATLRVKQADTSRKLHVTLCEGGLPYHIASDCYANFSAHKPDGTYIHNVCQIVNNAIEYAFTEQTTAAVGAVECEITLYDSTGQRITSPHFTIIVEARVYNGEEIVSSPEANALDALIDRAEVAAGNAENFVDNLTQYVENNFANAFKGYAEGTAIQVDDVSPMEHIVGCKVRSRNLYNDKNDYLGYSNYTYTDGVLTVSDIYVYKFIELEEGQKYTFSCKSSRTGTDGGGVFIRAYTPDKKSQINLTSGSHINILSPVVTMTIPKGYPIISITFYGYSESTGSGTTTYSNIMLEKGSVATDYSPYIDVSTVTANRNGEEFSVSADGTVNEMTSAYPDMTITTDNANAILEIEYNKDSNKVVQKLYDYITGETMPPVTKISSVKLLASNWVGDATPYSQVVSLSGITENSMVDLTPSVEQLAVFYNKDLAFVTENVGGVVTVYAIGQKPTNDYTIQVAITEVEA